MNEFPKEIWAAPEGQFGPGVDPIKLAPWTEAFTYEGSQRYIKADDHVLVRDYLVEITRDFDASLLIKVTRISTGDVCVFEMGRKAEG